MDYHEDPEPECRACNWFLREHRRLRDRNDATQKRVAELEGYINAAGDGMNLVALLDLYSDERRTATDALAAVAEALGFGDEQYTSDDLVARVDALRG